MSRLTYKEYLSIAVILAVIGVLGVLWQKPWEAGASVSAGGNAYRSTTTPSVADLTNLCPAGSGQASSTRGTLGSIVVLSQPSTGFLSVFDATTSDATLRAAIATTSMTLAWLPSQATTTTYTFDTQFERGLLIDYSTGVASTTITYRCGD